MLTSIFELEKRLKQVGSLSTLLKPEDFAPEDAVADVLASEFKDKLKPTQTRKIFHTIKQLENANRRKEASDPLDTDARMRLTLLSPELAYAAGRELIPVKFYEILKLALGQDKLKTVEDLRRLSQFLTAVIAYQKLHDFQSKGKGGR